MEFDIKELTITLLVGAFTILGFEAIAHCFVRTGPIGKLALNRKSPKEQPLTVVMLIVLAFGLGLIAEDLSLKWVDTNDFPFRKYPALALGDSVADKLGLPPATDDRARSLFGLFERRTPDPVAEDLAANCAFKIDDTKKTGERVQKWILQKPEDRCTPLQTNEPGSADCPSAGDLEASARSLYYFAKNTAYSRPESYDELKRIEDRLQFERSASMFAFVYFAISLILMILLLVWRVFTLLVPLAELLTRSKYAAKWSQKMRSSRGYQIMRACYQKTRKKMAASKRYKTREKVAAFWTNIYPYRWRWRFLGLVSVLLAVYFFTIWAYGRESDAFNRRVFGYFSTRLISEKRQHKQDWMGADPKECLPADEKSKP